MREDPTIAADRSFLTGVADDNVVTLPNLMSGRLADLLAAASGAGQEHEFGSELAARTAFRTASAAWPSSSRRRFRRTPAVLAVTTVATMMVATTGLAAATELPSPAGRAVQGILASVGVTATPPAPSGSDAGDVAAPVSGGNVSGGAHNLGARHGGCTTGGTGTYAVSGSANTSCTMTVPPPVAVTVTTTPRIAAPRASTHASTSEVAPTFHEPRSAVHQGGKSGGGTSGGQVPVTLPGGGTSRGGNQGGGGGLCGTGPPTTTTTTTTGTSTTTTTTPTDPGCGHHLGSIGGTSSTTTTIP